MGSAQPVFNTAHSTSTLPQADLVSWHVCETLAADDTGFTPADSARYTGFEYPDMVYDGDDMMLGIRTARPNSVLL